MTGGRADRSFGTELPRKDRREQGHDARGDRAAQSLGVGGIARYAIQPRDRSTADVAITIADDWQGRRLGLTLSRKLLCRAAGSGIPRLVGEVLHDNVRSCALLRELGFHQRGRRGDIIEFALELHPAG
jgi:RimJ/RimL family protein N-acetyltransferase